jgi:NDP-sugar pyrophosphorylase family protein
MDKKIDVLLLSGGCGSRVKSKIGNTPKALMQYNNDIAVNTVLYPFMHGDNVGVFKININIHSSEIEYFKDLGYNLLVEDIRNGNAYAIKKFCSSLSNPFIVVHNDVNLLDINLQNFYISHLQNDSMMTMVVKNIAETEKERGVIVKKYNKVLGFTRERWVNCGLYCVNHSVVENIEDSFQDIDNNLIPKLISIHQLCCYDYNGKYEDWGK